MDHLEACEKRGMVLPYEKQLIPHYEEIKLEFKEALEDHNAGKIPSTMIGDFNMVDQSSDKIENGGAFSQNAANSSSLVPSFRSNIMDH